MLDVFYPSRFVKSLFTVVAPIKQQQSVCVHTHACLEVRVTCGVGFLLPPHGLWGYRACITSNYIICKTTHWPH